MERQPLELPNAPGPGHLMPRKFQPITRVGHAVAERNPSQQPPTGEFRKCGTRLKENRKARGPAPTAHCQESEGSSEIEPRSSSGLGHPATVHGVCPVPAGCVL